MHSHFYDLGQQVSYAEDGIAWPWKGGFEVIALLPAGIDEPAYRIRNATRLMTVRARARAKQGHTGWGDMVTQSRRARSSIGAHMPTVKNQRRA